MAIQRALEKETQRTANCVKKRHLFALPLLSITLLAGPLGFVEQKFSDINFEKGKWERSAQPPCYTYTAREKGATVEVLRLGSGNLVPFIAEKGLKVTVCGSVAAFDEGFEAGVPLPESPMRQKPAR